MWEMCVRLWERMSARRGESYGFADPFRGHNRGHKSRMRPVRAESSSWDQEARQEYDMITANYSVQLRFWGSARQCIVMDLIGRPGDIAADTPRVRRVQITYCPGDEVIRGRDSRQERREVITLSIRTTNAMMSGDKEFLCQWLKTIVISPGRDRKMGW